MDSTKGSQEGKELGHTGGPSDKHHGREDEENMNMGNIDIVVCKPTDLTGLITLWLRLGVTSTGLDIGQARHEANVCSRGGGNLIL